MTECPLTKQELLDYGICRSLIKEDNRKKNSTNDFAPSWIRNTMQQQRNKPAVSVLPAVFFSPSFLESSLILRTCLWMSWKELLFAAVRRSPHGALGKRREQGRRPAQEAPAADPAEYVFRPFPMLEI